jgi:hypothetical protein
MIGFVLHKTTVGMGRLGITVMQGQLALIIPTQAAADKIKASLHPYSCAAGITDQVLILLLWILIFDPSPTQESIYFTVQEIVLLGIMHSDTQQDAILQQHISEACHAIDVISVADQLYATVGPQGPDALTPVQHSGIQQGFPAQDHYLIKVQLLGPCCIVLLMILPPLPASEHIVVEAIAMIAG